MKKEAFPLDEGDKTHQDTVTGGTGPKKPRSLPLPATLEGKTLEPDLKIDLTSEDARAELDAVQDAHGSPAEAGESRAVTPEDERELEEGIAEHDRSKAEHLADPIFDAEHWLDKAYADATHLLHELFEAGYGEDEGRRVAKTLAAEIKKEHHLETSEQELAEKLWERSKRRQSGDRPVETGLDEKEDEWDEPTQVDLPKQ